MTAPAHSAYRLWLLVIAAVAMFSFWPGLHGGFIFYDFPNLVRADAWKAASLAPAELWRALASDVSGALGRPLSLLSFALNHATTGLEPFWLKLTNLLWHLVNGALVWLLCRRLFSLLPAESRPQPWLAIVLALVWLLHPLQASTVLYVVQRMEIAAATGILLALLAYLVARARQMRGQRGGHWLLLALVAWSVGLGFKESALVAPAFALLVEGVLLKFSGPGGQPSRRWQATWAGIVFVALACWLLLVSSSIEHWPYETRGYGPWERVLTQLPVLVMYLKQILWPVPESMAFYYDNFPVSRGLFSPAWTAVSGLILAGLLALAVACHRRWPLTTLGIGWFFIAHSLTSNLWPLELAFEHRNYLALLGIVLALVQPLAWLGRRLNADAPVTLAILPVLLLAVLCNVQARTWGDPLRLAWTLEGRNPSSIRASYSLGERLYAESGGQPASPLWSMALGQMKHAAALPGDGVLPLVGQIQMLARAQQDVPEQLWVELRRGLINNGWRAEHAGALFSLVDCRISKLCQLDDAALLQTFLQLLERHPQQPVALTMYANFAWNVLGDRALAVRVQRDAVNLASGNLSMKVALAKFLLASGQADNVVEGRTLLNELRKSNQHGLLDRQIAELMQLEAATRT